MRRKIISIAVILGVILLVFFLRWAAVGISTRKAALRNTDSHKVAGGSNLYHNAEDLLQQGKRADAIKILEDVVSLREGSEEAYRSLLLLADIYRDDGSLLKAKEYYQDITKDYSAYCNYSEIQKRLTELNMAILFSKVPTEHSEIYTVKSGDTLGKIAKRYSTTIELIKKANNLETDLIRPGMRLKVEKTPFSIVIDKSQSSLTLIQGNEVIKTYTVSSGKNNSTPVGTFKIKNKLIDPVWYSTTAIVPPDSPENVLGSRWMGITTPEPVYGIHGTTEPQSIGYQSTEGCVRMYNADVEELYSIVSIGTEVTIID